MTRVAVGRENGHAISIAFEDHGDGRPVVLIAGFPLDRDSWEWQGRVLSAAGYRVISYDRRGFGASSRPATGYDFDTLAADLNALMERLDLRDAVLVGLSTGAGEVARYLGTYGSARVGRVAMLASPLPYLRRTEGNPAGVDPVVFDTARAAIDTDRYAYLQRFLDEAFGNRIGEQARRAAFAVAAASSPHATAGCAGVWLTDFRLDLPKIDVPTLVMHGTEDRILPFAATAQRLPALIHDVRLVPVVGGPHHIAWTYPEVVNPELLRFCRG